jgi:hypothetical protein
VAAIVEAMQYLVIERYKDRDAAPVYRRFRERGRLAPAGVDHVGSWVTEDLATCYQVMQAADRSVLDQWIENWRDLVDFEVIPVLSSAEALAAITPRL